MDPPRPPLDRSAAGGAATDFTDNAHDLVANTELVFDLEAILLE